MKPTPLPPLYSLNFNKHLIKKSTFTLNMNKTFCFWSFNLKWISGSWLTFSKFLKLIMNSTSQKVNSFYTALYYKFIFVILHEFEKLWSYRAPQSHSLYYTPVGNCQFFDKIPKKQSNVRVELMRKLSLWAIENGANLSDSICRIWCVPSHPSDMQNKCRSQRTSSWQSSARQLIHYC